MTNLEYVEAWSRAFDHLRAATLHRMEMSGKQGYEMANTDYWKAWDSYNTATRVMTTALDTLEKKSAQP